MCGIFGFAGKPKAKGKELSEFVGFMSALSVYTSTRGKDATGVASLILNKEAHKEDTLAVWKGPWQAKDAIKAPDFRKTIGRGYAAIGHVRAATHGNPHRPVNNHPFWGPRWAIVHNGVIRNYDKQMKIMGWKPLGECDSESILAAFENNDDPMDAYSTMVKDFEGAWAVTAIDREKNTLYLGRAGNPLSLAYSKKYKNWIFASIKDHIDKAAEFVKGGLGLEFHEIKEQEGLVSIEIARNKAPVKSLLVYRGPRTDNATKGPSWQDASYTNSSRPYSHGYEDDKTSGVVKQLPAKVDSPTKSFSREEIKAAEKPYSDRAKNISPSSLSSLYELRQEPSPEDSINKLADNILTETFVSNVNNDGKDAFPEV